MKRKLMVLILVIFAAMAVLSGCGGGKATVTTIDGDQVKKDATVEQVSHDFIQAYLYLDFDKLNILTANDLNEQMASLKEALKGEKIKRQVETKDEIIKVLEEKGDTAKVELKNTATIKENFIIKKDYSGTTTTTYHLTLKKIKGAWRVVNSEEVAVQVQK